MKKKIKKSEHVVVRITPQQLKMIINHIKDEEGVTLSDFIRKSINKLIYDETKL